VPRKGSTVARDQEKSIRLQLIYFVYIFCVHPRVLDFEPCSNQSRASPMTQRSTDLLISIAASAISLLLSWPFWRDFEYWPESPLAWYLYFALGFVLAVYVFQVFIGSLRELFEHEAGHELDEER